MDQIEIPLDSLWNERRDWFERQFDVECRLGGYMLGEHANALLIDLQAIFCAGAFISTLIISCTIADSHLRETEAGPNFSGGIQAAFALSKHQDELNWLRIKRNQLIHFSEKNSFILSVDDHYTQRNAHEIDARRAIQVVSNLLFEHPFI